MTEKQRQNVPSYEIEHDQLSTKNDSIMTLQREQNRLQECLKQSEKNVDLICQYITTLSQQIDEEFDFLIKAETFSESNKKESSALLKKVEETYNETIKNHEARLNAYKEEYDGKVKELAIAEEECVCLRFVLQQKQNSISESQKQLQIETDRLGEQREHLSNVIYRAEAKADNSKFVEEQKNLQAESAQLNRILIEKQADVEDQRKENSSLSEELTKLQEHSSLQSIQLSTIQLRFDENKATYAHEENENRSLMTQIQATEEKQTEETAQLEGQLVEKLATYENVEKTIRRLIEQINSEFRDMTKLEEVSINAKAELLELTAECTQLDSSIDEISELIALNETILAKLNAEKEDMLDQWDKQQFVAESIMQNLDFRQAVRQLNITPDHENYLEEKDDDVFIRPVTEVKRETRRNVKQYSRKRHHDQEQEVAAPSPDSSVSDLWSTEFTAVAPSGKGDHTDTVGMFQQFFL